jgi:hypothetical protein
LPGCGRILHSSIDLLHRLLSVLSDLDHRKIELVDQPAESVQKTDEQPPNYRDGKVQGEGSYDQTSPLHVRRLRQAEKRTGFSGPIIRDRAALCGLAH